MRGCGRGRPSWRPGCCPAEEYRTEASALQWSICTLEARNVLICGFVGCSDWQRNLITSAACGSLRSVLTSRGIYQTFSTHTAREPQRSERTRWGWLWRHHWWSRDEQSPSCCPGHLLFQATRADDLEKKVARVQHWKSEVYLLVAPCLSCGDPYDLLVIMESLLAIICIPGVDTGPGLFLSVLT